MNNVQKTTLHEGLPPNIHENGGPAFPLSVCAVNDRAGFATDSPLWGMCLRDWFAGQALIAIGPVALGPKVGEECYRIAEIMLEARKQ